MTTTTMAQLLPAVNSTRRRALGYATIAATLPYLVLKLIWIFGGDVGFTEETPDEDGAFLVLNIVTFAMDAVAVVLALAFTREWGLRLPAWLVAFPMWVGTGLLAPIVAIAPASLVANTVLGNSYDKTDPGIVEPWVYSLVYSGFVAQALLLVTVAALYAWQRWSALFRVTLADIPAGKTSGLQKLIVNALLPVIGIVAMTYFAWGFGATVGLPADMIDDRNASTYIGALVFGAFSVLACAGIILLVHRKRPQIPFWIPATMTWVGAGGMFAWGLWNVVLTLTQVDMGSGSNDSVALLNITSLFQFVAGLLVGVVGALVLIERHDGIAQHAMQKSDSV